MSNLRALGEDAAESEEAASSRGLTLAWAARLAMRDVNVIAVRAGDKRPSEDWKRWTRESQGDALGLELDEWLCERWLDTEHNLGVVTGAVSQIVVLDTDDDSGDALVASTCDIPETVRVATAHGSHYWFAHPGGEVGNRARIGGVGLDVRGDGGYVLAPPSMHPSGTRYEWTCSPLDLWPPAPLPEELISLISRVPGTEKTPPTPLRRLESPVSTRIGSRYAQAALDAEVANVAAAPEGTRNDQLNRSAFAIARLVPEHFAAREVADAFLHAAACAGLDEREAQATIASALRGRT